MSRIFVAGLFIFAVCTWFAFEFLTDSPRLLRRRIATSFVWRDDPEWAAFVDDYTPPPMPELNASDPAPYWRAFIAQRMPVEPRWPVRNGSVAMCLSGGIRTYLRNKESFYNNTILPNEPIDVFAYLTVYANDSAKYGARDQQALRHMRESGWFVAVETVEYDEAIRAEIAAEHPLPRYVQPPAFDCIKWPHLNMLRSIAKCQEMITRHEDDNQFSYEWIMRNRPDLRHKGPCQVRLCPAGHICDTVGPLDDYYGRRRIEDLLLWGSNAEMKLFAGFYFIVDQVPDLSSPACWPEHYLWQAFVMLGLDSRTIAAPGYAGYVLDRDWHEIKNKP